uniref:Uncharacterized protein n=1 Tax=Arundo donax TaxID=35708 RepID=A0A0A9EW43_ARUDO
MLTRRYVSRNMKKFSKCTHQ